MLLWHQAHTHKCTHLGHPVYTQRDTQCKHTCQTWQCNACSCMHTQHVCSTCVMRAHMLTHTIMMPRKMRTLKYMHEYKSGHMGKHMCYSVCEVYRYAEHSMHTHAHEHAHPHTVRQPFLPWIHCPATRNSVLLAGFRPLPAAGFCLIWPACPGAKPASWRRGISTEHRVQMCKQQTNG